MSDLEDSDAEAQAMAAAMGFSSFGAAPARKKRKFNPATDSFVEGDQLEKIDRGGKKGKGSGGNDIPLGKKRVFGQKEKMVKNDDEIELSIENEEEEEDGGDGDGGVSIGEGRGQEEVVRDPRLRIRRSLSPRQDEEDDEDGPRYMDTSEAAPVENTNYAPAYMDTSIPPPLTTTSLPYIHPHNAAALDAQAQIDNILGFAQIPPGSSAVSYPPPPGSATYPSNQQYQNMISDRILVKDVKGGGWGRGSDTASMTSKGRGRGEHNPRWYIDYYDLSFNENPWKALEQAMGLKSVGTWVERPEKQV